jgi:hypothetical protein
METTITTLVVELVGLILDLTVVETEESVEVLELMQTQEDLDKVVVLQETQEVVEMEQETVEQTRVAVAVARPTKASEIPDSVMFRVAVVAAL